ncbi:MAG: NapC/NirT family cytochrome c [Thermodesulfovibrionales bacterium]|nr:NapC/NirT family cytochrome c [Thermodesulfovibrionales bacterium]
MRISHSVKGFIIAVFLMLTFLYGYRYYHYTQTDPDFCSSCHLVREAYIDWQRSSHSRVVCQKCHEIGILEQNQRLLSYIARGVDPISLNHGRQKPWLQCEGCHKTTIVQGAVSPDKAYGHAKHAIIQKIKCSACHLNRQHNLPFNGDSCIQCHQNKEVHGISIREFSCINCHPFIRKHLVMTPPEKCTKCHLEMSIKNPKSKLSCHYCHKPHLREKVRNATCAGCHKTEVGLGQHGNHAKQGIECMYCHKPHIWNIKETEKNRLCKECHSYKDPRSFIYIF